MAGESKVTTNHEQIKRWIEARGGHPATVASTSDDGDAGILRVDFPGYSGDRLEPIDWSEFFDKFEQKRLAFLYQDEQRDGEASRFFKFVDRKDHGKEHGNGKRS